MTPKTIIMVPWHPVPGDIPPEGCLCDWATAPDEDINCEIYHSPTGWSLWCSANRGNREVEQGDIDPVDGFVFCIPLPPQYAVTITDDTTLQDAVDTHFDMIHQTPEPDSIMNAYADAVVARIRDYVEHRHAI